MTVAACADLVQRGDPDRFRAVMAAPVEARAQLFPLYAFNLEVARAPWVTQEPLIAEMRLQWWRDVVENAASGAARAHEVAGPLHDLIRDFGLPVDVHGPADRRPALGHPPRTARGHRGAERVSRGHRRGVDVACRALSVGAPDAIEGPVRAYGWATAAAMYIRAVPELETRGRQPLPDGLATRDLGQMGLEKLAEARADRASLSRQEVAPALLAGWQTEGLLRQVVAGRPSPDLPEVGKRWRLLWQVISGRW